MTPILAQLAGGYSLIQVIIFLIVLCGVFGILFVVMRQTGIQVPPWIITIFWIVVVCFVAIFAIRLLMSM
ncbi:MAG TPA: hypothetical protein VNG71_13915 [Pyrinomonadaceae bacterium]|nr:hypothetical protein [Pyrinomonadaceae bacterium]